MATVTIYADTGDQSLQSHSATYSTLQAGGGTFDVYTGMAVGQHFASSEFYAWQAFIAFDTSGVPAASSAELTIKINDPLHGTTEFDVEARLVNFGATVEAADWVPSADLTNYPLLAKVNSVGVTTTNQLITLTETAGSFANNLVFGGTTRVMLSSSIFRTGPGATSDQSFTFWGTAQAGTTDDPRVTVVAVPAASTDEILNPSTDEAVNGWTTDTGATTGLVTAIDETVASDADYIQSPAGPTTADYYETALETHADPVSSSGHIVHYRYQKNVAGGVVDLAARLIQGAVAVERLTANQQSIETDTTGWEAGSNTTISRSTAQSYDGAASLALTAIASGAISAITPWGLSGIPALAGAAFTMSCRTRAATTPRTIEISVLYYDATGAEIGSPDTHFKLNTTTEWNVTTGMSGVIPSGTVRIALRVQVINGPPAAGEVHYFDDFHLSTIPVVGYWPHTNIPNTWTQQDQTLTGPQADSITDYSDLRLRFTPSITTRDVVPTFVADRATANSNSDVTTVDLVLTDLTIGNYLIIRSAADNSGGGGSARSFTVSNLVGTAMGTHTEYQHNCDPGAARAGTTVNVSVIKIAATSGTIRLTYSGSVVQACVAEEWSGIDATTPVANNWGGTAPFNSSGIGNITATTVNAWNLVYAPSAIEGPSSDTYTQDSDTTRGSWTSLTKVGTTNATADANQTTWGGYKVVNASGLQQYAGSVSPARDSATYLLDFNAAPPTIRAQVSWANFELPTGLSIQVLAGTTSGAATTTAAVDVAHPLAATSAGIATVSAEFEAAYREAWGMVLI